jgi:hypothetical protein
VGGPGLKALYFLCAVFAEVVEDGVGFREGSVGARRTGKGRGSARRGTVGGSIRMTRGDVKGKSRGLEELLVAVGALEREVSFVLLEMIVHSILTFLCNTAMVANVEASGILLIDIGHWVGVG